MKRRTFLGVVGLAAVAPKAAAEIVEHATEPAGPRLAVEAMEQVRLHAFETVVPTNVAAKLRALTDHRGVPITVTMYDGWWDAHRAGEQFPFAVSRDGATWGLG